MKYKRLTAQGDDASFYDRTIEECERDYYRLKELEDKIENGTLVESPCKAKEEVIMTGPIVVGDVPEVEYTIEVAEYKSAKSNN